MKNACARQKAESGPLKTPSLLIRDAMAEKIFPKDA
jgi:hypothetical protein